MKKTNLLTGTLTILAIAWLALPIIHSARRLCPVRPTGVGEAQAITAWARKYGVSCTVCHTAGYKLTGPGQKFLRAGHKMPGDASMTDAKLTDYLAVTGKLRSAAKYSKVAEQDKADVIKTGSGFQAHAFSIYTGGPLDKGFSYFGEMYLSENESVSESPTKLADEQNSLQGNWARSKLAEMYLQYHHAFNDDAFVSARMGRIMSSLVHLHGGGARLEYSRPLPFMSSVGDNPYRTYNRQYGWALGSAYKDLFLELGLVNGTGKNENAVELDTEHHKDVFATMDYSLDSNGSMIGAYFYKGYYPLHWLAKAQGGDRFYQYGLLGNYTFNGSVNGALVGSLLWGNDRFTPTGSTAEMNHRSLTYYAEAQAHFKDGDIAPYVKWEYFDKDTALPDNEKFGPALGMHYKPFDHGRFVLEYSRYLTRGNTVPANPNTGKKKDTINQDLTLELQFMF